MSSNILLTKLQKRYEAKAAPDGKKTDNNAVYIREGHDALDALKALEKSLGK